MHGVTGKGAICVRGGGFRLFTGLKGEQGLSELMGFFRGKRVTGFRSLGVYGLTVFGGLRHKWGFSGGV